MDTTQVRKICSLKYLLFSENPSLRIFLQPSQTMSDLRFVVLIIQKISVQGILQYQSNYVSDDIMISGRYFVNGTHTIGLQFSLFQIPGYNFSGYPLACDSNKLICHLNSCGALHWSLFADRTIYLRKKTAKKTSSVAPATHTTSLKCPTNMGWCQIFRQYRLFVTLL